MRKALLVNGTKILSEGPYSEQLKQFRAGKAPRLVVIAKEKTSGKTVKAETANA